MFSSIPELKMKTKLCLNEAQYGMNHNKSYHVLWIVFTLLIFSTVSMAQQRWQDLPVVFQIESETTIRDVDWNFDSTLLAFANGYDTVSIIDIAAGTIDVQLDRVTNEIAVIHAIGWSPTQNHLLIANNLTKIWDYSENEWLNDFEFPTALDFVEYTPGNFDWYPEGNRFAIILRECDEGTPNRPGARVEVWDVATSTFTQIAGCISRGFGEVKWNPQGTQLAINGFSVFDDDGFVDFEEIEIWNGGTAKRILTITDLQDPWGLAWSPTGHMIAFTTTIQFKRYMKLWDVINNELVWQVETNSAVYPPLEWHPSENLIAMGGQDGSVRIWDALSGTELIELPAHEDTVNDVSWSPDGSMLASAGRDGQLFIWDVSDLQQINKIS